MISLERARALLTDLIALPSVNPMGRGPAPVGPVEKGVLDYMERLLSGFPVQLQRGPCSPLHESLLVRLEGARPGPATLLEAHADTVPAEDWAETAFKPRSEGNTVFGRGACDNKGSLAAMTLAVLDLLESGTVPPTPVLFLIAGDEEFHQTGIKHFAATAPPLARAIVGEPTQLRPVLQHKGTIRWDIVIHGRSAHSAQPELGIDAIRGALLVCDWLRHRELELQRQHRDPWMTGPTLGVTTIQGGRTRNAIADECVLSLDFRVTPGMEPHAARMQLMEDLERTRSNPQHELGRLRVRIEHRSPQTAAPPLSTSPEHPFSRRVLGLCRHALGIPDLPYSGAPYCTDASWIAAHCPTLVLGPGSIEYAHAIDERIDLQEVVRCAEIYRNAMVAPLG